MKLVSKPSRPVLEWGVNAALTSEVTQAGSIDSVKTDLKFNVKDQKISVAGSLIRAPVMSRATGLGQQTCLKIDLS